MKETIKHGLKYNPTFKQLSMINNDQSNTINTYLSCGSMVIYPAGVIALTRQLKTNLTDQNYIAIPTFYGKNFQIPYL